MADEPTSLLALGLAALVFVERAFDRWMQWNERRRNGRKDHAGTRNPLDNTRTERGAVGNGAKAIVQRLDQIDDKLIDAKADRSKLWEQLSKVSVRCARLEGRLGHADEA